MKTIAGNFALEFSRRLRSLLSQKDINGVKLAEICSVNKSTAYGWINGEGFPKNDKLQIIADFFGVSVNYLLGKDEDTRESNCFTFPISINTLEEAKSFLKLLNLYDCKEIALYNKSEEDVINIAKTLHFILIASSKL